jgi:hypothetical protein
VEYLNLKLISFKITTMFRFDQLGEKLETKTWILKKFIFGGCYVK